MLVTELFTEKLIFKQFIWDFSQRPFGDFQDFAFGF